MTAPFIEQVRRAWQSSGRDGAPRIVALAYFSLGDTEQESRANLLDYYRPAGDEMAQMVAGAALRSPGAVRDAIQAYQDIGVDEFILDPTVGDPNQVQLLAQAALT